MAKTRIVSQDIGDGTVLPADLDVTADNTTADSTTGHHGLLPKLGGGTTNYLRADGSWNAPPGTGGSGAPSTVDYLVGTADGGLSAEIVVGTTPGGELGNTWASPTVDAIHAGNSHPVFKVSAGSDTSVQTFSNTDLSFAVDASTVYVFQFHIYFFTNATSVGIRLAVNGPTGATGRWGLYVPTAASSNAVNAANGQLTALDTAIFATTTGPGVSPVYAIMSGSMTIAGTSGNLVLRHASETSTQTVIEAGSWGFVARVA
jgi:hypothetical protein